MGSLEKHRLSMYRSEAAYSAYHYHQSRTIECHKPLVGSNLQYGVYLRGAQPGYWLSNSIRGLESYSNGLANGKDLRGTIGVRLSKRKRQEWGGLWIYQRYWYKIIIQS